MNRRIGLLLVLLVMVGAALPALADCPDGAINRAGMAYYFPRHGRLLRLHSPGNADIP